MVLGKPESKNSRVRWLCMCDCGAFVRVLASNLSAASVTRCHDCTCAARARSLTKHDQSRTKLYHVWGDMVQRCTNPNLKNFKYYGGKGVVVCTEWREFAVFAEWARAAGYADGMTIERKDTAIGYTPSNCEWITRAENSRRSALARHAKAANV